MCALLLILPAVHAQAQSTGNINFPSNGTGVLPDLVFPGTVTAGRDTPVGTVLSSKASQQIGLSASGVTCSITKTVTVNGTPVPGLSKTYQTNVPGIGVRFYITTQWNNQFVQAPVTQTLPANNGTFGHYTKAELVATGPIHSGTLIELPSMTVKFSGSCIDTKSTTQYLTVGTAITGSTCDVTMPSIAVELPKAFSTNLETAGATTGDTPLKLGVNCAAGVKVNVTISDAANPTNETTALSLAPGSSAAGVGVQLHNGSSPVAFGPDSAVAGNKNQWSAGTASGGPMEIPLTARYVRTSGTLIPGSVKATATFTMSYE